MCIFSKYLILRAIRLLWIFANFDLRSNLLCAQKSSKSFGFSFFFCNFAAMNIKHMWMNNCFRLLGAMLVCMLPLVADAYDFKSGTLYYTIVSKSQKTVEVAYGGTYSNRVVVPAEVTYQNKKWKVVGLGPDAFYGSGKMTELVLPRTLKYISGGALDYCTGLTRLDLPEGVTLRRYCLRHAGLVSLRIPKGTQWHGDHFGQLSNMPWLTSVEFAEGIDTIPVAAFQFDSKLERVILPNTLKRIGKYAFVGCTSLKVLDIPSSVLSMGRVVDDGKSALREIHVHWQDPIRIVTNTFTNETYLEGVLYVPRNTKVKYRQMVGWRNFKNIEEVDEF